MHCAADVLFLHVCLSRRDRFLTTMQESYTHVRVDPAAGTITCTERARILANRVAYSRFFTTLYACVLVLSTLLFIWVIIEADYPLDHAVKFWVFVLADGAVTCFIILEVTLNMVAVGVRRFCARPSNVLDAAVVVLCVTVIFLHVLGSLAELELEEEVELAILVARYAAQIARLTMLVKNLRAQARASTLHN